MPEDCSFVPYPYGWQCECFDEEQLDLFGAEVLEHLDFNTLGSETSIEVIKCSDNKFALVRNNEITGRRIMTRDKMMEYDNLRDATVGFNSYVNSYMTSYRKYFTKAGER